MNKTTEHEDVATEEDREKRTRATTILNVTMPPIIGLLMFALINYTVSKGLCFVALTLLTTFLAVLMPLSILIIWARRTHAHDLDVPVMADRGLPLLVAATSYFIGAAVLLLIPAPPLTAVVMVGYCAGTLVIFLINLRWKISVHTTRIAGPTIVFLSSGTECT
jgi:hypothetical protein